MYYIGLMSGTSMDAIDVAIVDIRTDHIELYHYAQYPLENTLRDAIKTLTAYSSIAALAKLDERLGQTFAKAVLTSLNATKLTPCNIQAIGHPGQTILHLPNARQTLQIGDPNIVAYKTGITTISDFRRMDLAAGGQGAPLAPMFHAACFRTTQCDRIILNIGGISNITLLPADPHRAILGFDTGPGNGLLDDWNKHHQGTRMDENGSWAATGTVNQTLLNHMLQDPYFSLPIPKSTGRDYFNMHWLDTFLQKYNKPITPADTQATLLFLTVESIARDVKKIVKKQHVTLYLCGGGAHNLMMTTMLQKLLPNIDIQSTNILGINPDAVESACFAWYAYCRIHQICIQSTTVTGAKNTLLYGAIYAGKSQ